MAATEPHLLEKLLAKAWPPDQWADITVLLAVSGGCDSVSLLRAMCSIRIQGKGRLCVAHVNHQLRPDADRDETFVSDLCRQLGVPCETERVTIQGTGGIEASARTARYQFLKQAAGRLGARYIVTAHTADDQVETILHRILRGTGIGGLAGMARTRPIGHATLIRPLLGVRHAILEDYLLALDQPFCVDSSNTNPRFTRNRIRHELLPWLEQSISSSVSDGVLRLGRLAGEVQGVVDQLVDGLFDQHVVLENDNTAVVRILGMTETLFNSKMRDHFVKNSMFRRSNMRRRAVSNCNWCETSPYVLRELLMEVWRRQNWPMQAMGFVQWEQLGDMASAALTSVSSVPRQTLPGNVSVEIADGQMRLTRNMDALDPKN